MREGTSKVIHRADYQPPAFWIDTVELCFDLDPAKTRVLNRMRTNMQTGTLPGQTLFDGMALAVAAVFLIIPGFLGDLVAILLLLPPVRAWLYKTLTRNMRVVETTTTYRNASDPTSRHLEGPGTIDLDDDDWQRK